MVSMGSNVHTIGFSAMLTRPFQDKDFDSRTMNHMTTKCLVWEKIKNEEVQFEIHGKGGERVVEVSISQAKPGFVTGLKVSFRGNGR